LGERVTSWPEACEFCKGYPLPPGSGCTCEPVSIRYKYAGLNPVVTGKPTSPERPSNKPSPGSYDDRALQICL
jgi:hypothetical protein